MVSLERAAQRLLLERLDNVLLYFELQLWLHSRIVCNYGSVSRVVLSSYITFAIRSIHYVLNASKMYDQFYAK